jgi:hypothetical protein
MPLGVLSFNINSKLSRLVPYIVTTLNGTLQLKTNSFQSSESQFYFNFVQYRFAWEWNFLPQSNIAAAYSEISWIFEWTQKLEIGQKSIFVIEVHSNKLGCFISIFELNNLS